MSDAIPEVAWPWPPKGALVHLRRVGRKCIVRATPYDESRWLEAGGASMADICVDSAQARVYYQRVGQQDPECRVVLPDDAPFRACRKGKVDGRSKSYDKTGNPVPEVRLLYALKTGLRDDRMRAVGAFPVDVWSAITRVEIHTEMQFYAATDENFRILVGERLAQSAAQQGGLSDWSLWERVADDAAAYTKQRLAIDNGEMPPNYHSIFVRAVKETTIEFHGLPAQCHVKKRWEELGGRGEWREIRKTLGFEWIPALIDWKKSWPQSRR